MFVPGDNDVINSDESYRAGEAQTDRVNGEYHYKNGYTQKIYSDAHYVREEDNTGPPRYYTPPEKPARKPKEPKTPSETGRRVGTFARTLCLCLVCALLGGAFVTSNRESGDGRYDIQLKPTQKGLPGILNELKAEKNCSDEQLTKLSETALQQINDKKYETELTTAGVRTIYKYGVAFSGKKVEVAVR